MKKGSIYTSLHNVSAAIMIVALLWLTISLPFVYDNQQKLAAANLIENSGAPLTGNEEEAANPFSGGTEEKAPNSGGNFSEEYFHDHHKADYFFSILKRYHNCENVGTYIAFHGELLVPPPNFA